MYISRKLEGLFLRNQFIIIDPSWDAFLVCKECIGTESKVFLILIIANGSNESLAHKVNAFLNNELVFAKVIHAPI